MGIETLYSAAYAAGFAMAAPEESYDDIRAEPRLGMSVEAQWQPSRAVLARKMPGDGAGPRPPRTGWSADWLGLVLGLLGRRPPARRPALTAEA
jgi:hypothetical protein